MKFRDGYMIKSGQASKDYVDSATRHVLLRQGVLGIKVAIMLPWDPKGELGPKKPQPDVVKVREPKEDEHTAPQVPYGQPQHQTAVDTQSTQQTPNQPQQTQPLQQQTHQ